MVVLYKKACYMGSIKTCLLQEGMIYGVNNDYLVTRMHVVWSQYGRVCYKEACFMESVTRELQGDLFYGVSKGLSVTRKHVILSQ
jgi:hypothetical protein